MNKKIKFIKEKKMSDEGFEPSKHIASDLESLPFDRSGTLPLTL